MLLERPTRHLIPLLLVLACTAISVVPGDVFADDRQQQDAELYGEKTLDEWIVQATEGRTLEDRENALQIMRNFGLRRDRDKTLRAFTELLTDESPTLPDDAPITPEARRGIAVAFQRASLQDWTLTKSLYEKYGGRVGMGSMGAWIAFDGQNALLLEHYKAGDIKFHHEEIGKAFWEQTKKKTFADTYPTGARLGQPK